jgi:hypothetical protein
MRRSIERELFEKRAARRAPPPPPFAEVLARATKRERPSLWQRVYPRIGLAAAAVIAGLFLAKKPPPAPRDLDNQVTITAEPITDLACVESPPPSATREADGVIAGMEDAYHACLVASPGEIHNLESKNQIRTDDHESDVTCGCPGPSGDEASEEAACEGSHR